MVTFFICSASSFWPNTFNSLNVTWHKEDILVLSKKKKVVYIGACDGDNVGFYFDLLESIDRE